MNIPDYLIGRPVRKHPILPFQTTYQACNIETREIENIPSGEYVHAMQVGYVWLVSEQIWNELQKL